VFGAPADASFADLAEPFRTMAWCVDLLAGTGDARISQTAIDSSHLGFHFKLWREIIAIWTWGVICHFAHTCARAQLQPERTFSFQPPRAHPLARALMEADSYVAPEAAHACARVGNPQFSPISPTSRTHVRQYPEGQIPGTCTGERTRARAAVFRNPLKQ